MLHSQVYFFVIVDDFAAGSSALWKQTRELIATRMLNYEEFPTPAEEQLNRYGFSLLTLTIPITTRRTGEIIEEKRYVSASHTLDRDSSVFVSNILKPSRRLQCNFFAVQRKLIINCRQRIK